MNKKKNYRPDRDGDHQGRYDKNRKIIIQRNDYCALCGKPVDKSLKYPHPFSASVDHIKPVSKGGHPSNLSNLQLTHLVCNISKGAKFADSVEIKNEELKNNDLPHLMDWKKYRGK